MSLKLGPSDQGLISIIGELVRLSPRIPKITSVPITLALFPSALCFFLCFPQLTPFCSFQNGGQEWSCTVVKQAHPLPDTLVQGKLFCLCSFIGCTKAAGCDVQLVPNKHWKSLFNVYVYAEAQPPSIFVKNGMKDNIFKTKAEVFRILNSTSKR